ncbi:uncharacterized protein LOC144662235 [Oculina patagonica]
MTRILGFIILLAFYQEVEPQRTIHWGRLLCEQVETKCKQDFIGSPGVIGPPGVTGPTGVAGNKGIRGERGPKGSSYIVEPFPLHGSKGRKGQPGLPGVAGPKGTAGRNGPKGNPGARGVVGVKGFKGTRGFPGVQGSKGQPGTSGSILSWKTCSWKHDPLQQYGLLKECIFNKQSERSVLHVTFEGSMRVGFCNSCCKRWFFSFDGLECQTANIEARLQGNKAFAGMEYRHVRLEGYCALPAGQVAVELWVEDCAGHQRAPKVPFIKVDLNPRITVEEISMNQI